jgi:SAM-dependent MidA family methyltransferase
VDPDLALRRPADLAPAPEPGSNPVLVARIEGEIRRAGPMTFARFMELVLYHPEAGYYTGPRPGPGRRGDFLTAPEAHPIFGWALARQAVELWALLGRPDPFVIREHGAGGGALGAAMLDGLRASGSTLLEAVRYQPVEVAARRVAELQERLERAGHGARLDPAGAIAPPMTGLIVANEVLDALPVHRVRGTDSGIEELYVSNAAGRLEEVPGPPSDPRLEARLADEEIVLRPGQVAEICLALDGWINDAAAELARGLLLLIDYGHPAPELYDPVRRPRGTLLSYRHHRAVDDPFSNLGRQDLTAHVDLTAVERSAGANGLERVGSTTQAEFMAGLGAGDLLAALQQRPSTSAAEYLEARSALVRMIDPGAMGRFRVLAFGRGLGERPGLRGFAFQLRR